MSRADVGPALFWIAIAVWMAYAAFDLGLGSVQDPGSGFVLFWVAVSMLALSVAVLAAALRARAGEAGALWSDTRWGKIASVVLALIVYAVALPRLGFILTTTLVLFFLFKVIEPQRWWVAIVGAVASAIIGYVVFKVWLGAQLPSGWLEIG